MEKVIFDSNSFNPYIFGSGLEGDVTITKDTVMSNRPYNFRNLIINKGASLTFPLPKMTLYVQGTLYVEGHLNMDGKAGIGTTSLMSRLNAPSRKNARMELINQSQIPLWYDSLLRGVYIGDNYGLGAGADGANKGGGLLRIYASNVLVKETGEISSDGLSGKLNSTNQGCSGGVVEIYCNNLENHGCIRANGGAPGYDDNVLSKSKPGLSILGEDQHIVYPSAGEYISGYTGGASGIIFIFKSDYNKSYDVGGSDV